MNIPIFLSYPKPFLKKQQEFIEGITTYLAERSFAPRTLGVTDYDVSEPLTAIRRLMLESNGVLVIAFRRYEIINGRANPNSDIDNIKGHDLSNQWQTSPWCQIEPAMAFQIGLPILILREKGVIADGILEKGVIGTYMSEFDLDGSLDTYFLSQQWKQIIAIWEGYVRRVVENKGHPPILY
jgi:hypothetical protein